jgi:periplasmic protein TonB
MIYPSRTLREGRESVTRLTLTISAGGNIDDCQITGSSGYADLDQAARKGLMRRARFNPARNGNGENTGGSHISALRWVIP